MVTIVGELWVCTRCMILSVNGDDIDPEGTEQPWSLEPSADVAPNFGNDEDSSDEDNGERDFSKSPCDACGDTDHGSRFRFAVFGK
jgi:hypothetical protein